jgi:hypothetical protein
MSYSFQVPIRLDYLTTSMNFGMIAAHNCSEYVDIVVAVLSDQHLFLSTSVEVENH